MSKRTQKSLEATAYHEAGHAVIAWREGIKIKEISIVPDKKTLGHVNHDSILKRINMDSGRSKIIWERGQKIIKISLAGIIAQRKYSPRSVRNYHDHSDYQNAAEVGNKMVGTIRQLDALLKFLSITVEDTLNLKWIWEKVEILADKLSQLKRMSGEDAEELIKFKSKIPVS